MQQHQPFNGSDQQAAQERAELNAGVLDGATTGEEIALNDDHTPPERIGSSDADTNADLANNGGLGRSDA